MQWWQWLVLGLVLVALEMAASGGFYVIFFGIAALAIGGLHLFGLAGPAWFQFLLFSVLSVASLEVAAEWGVTLGPPFTLARYSYIALAGDDAPEGDAARGRESDEEADAFALWGATVSASASGGLRRSAGSPITSRAGSTTSGRVG